MTNEGKTADASERSRGATVGPVRGGEPQGAHRAAATASTAMIRHAWGPWWRGEVNADDWRIWVNDDGGLAAQQTAKPSAEDVQV